jgi:leucyl/phenylalanyl-tRNA--protein transferase
MGKLAETPRDAMSEPLPPELLLEAYSTGIFPMGMPGGGIRWFSPDPRGILPLEGFHVPHGLRRALRRPGWKVRVDTCFREVMSLCGERDETWISKLILRGYGRLHELGHAHSVEVWKDDRLAGGLYGVALGGAFFGESMFHRVTDASKVALWHLVRILREEGFTLLDIQWTTDHLRQFGAVDVGREQYLHLLREAVALKGSFPPPGPLSAGNGAAV